VRRNIDPRELPAYPLSEAAHYLRIPKATLSSWVHGRPYPTDSGTKFFKPLIDLPESANLVLSFVNLVEAHVLSAIRKDHGVTLPRVRKALNYVVREFEHKHPLADQRFETDGIDLFVDHLQAKEVPGLPDSEDIVAEAHLVNASRDGQLALRELIKARLRRVERDPAGIAVRLYPYTRKDFFRDQPRAVVIDPNVSFGRPVLAGSGIPTAIVAERYKAGESMDALAMDYGRSRLDIEEAVRCELPAEAA
jgi:uncharacterized protein (DUF433 family)